MYSLTVPVPGRVGALAGDISRELTEARARARGEHTLGVKRFTAGHGTYDRIEAKVREAIAGQSPFEIRLVDLRYFEEASIGTTPVIYLAVESAELRRLHSQLVEVFSPVEGIEGEAYTPHVTVARGGSVAAAEQITGREIEPMEWTVSELTFWDATRNTAVSSISLPA